MSAHTPRSHPMFATADTSFTVESQQNSLLLFERLFAAASSPTRAREAIVVWTLLCKRLDTWNHNLVITTAAEIAHMSGFKDAHSVGGAIDLLIAVGAMRLVPPKPNHRKNTYHLSPYLVWRGAPAARSESVAQWDARSA